MLSNKKQMKKLYAFLILAGLMSFSLLGQTEEVLVGATKDNSIYQEGELSNGSGIYLFTGVTNRGNKRRALIKFDLSNSLPEGVMADSASLILAPSLVKTNGTSVNIYRLNAEWGEGSSDAGGEEGKGAPATEGDATWIKSTLTGDPWVKPGGDYDLESLASTSVSLGAKAEFGSSSLTELVNSWINDPDNNYGVIVIGDESKSATAIRFNSREYSNSELWPMLKLYYKGANSSVSNKLNLDKLLIYPDQSSGDLMLKNDYGNLYGRVELYSITGSLLYSGRHHLREGENRINSGIAQSGIYLYRIVTDVGILSGKLMFQPR